MGRVAAVVGCLLIALLAVIGACSDTPSDGGPTPTIGRQITFTPPTDPDPATAPLPKNAAGQLRLTPGAPVEIGWAPPTPGPMTALAQCTRWISRCVSPPDRTVDDCARSVPTCATNEPWNESACCPKTCFDRYVASRNSGAKEVDAFNTAYFDRANSCFPGMTALLQVKP